MNQQPLVSVIVPIYNVEEYLDECISSILAQTYSNLEVLLIDDGSPDGSGLICDRYAEQDSRVRVVHKPNGGTGSARNLGLEMSTGEWIAFMDADDAPARNMISEMLALVDEETDFVECNISKEPLDTLSVNTDVQVMRVDAATAMRANLRDERFLQLPGGKMLRRSAIGEIRYPLNVQHEDEFFNYRVVANSRSLVYTSAILFYYRQRDGSVMNVPYRISRADPLVAFQQRLELVQERFPELEYDARVSLMLHCMYVMDGTLGYLKGSDRALLRSKVHTIMAEQKTIFPKKGNGFRRNLWVVSFQIWPEGTSFMRNLVRRLFGLA